MLTAEQQWSDTQYWAQGLGQVGSHPAQEREAELARVQRTLDEALIENDRAEILAQFDRAVVLFAQAQRWHEGLAAAREVFATVARWLGFDAEPYALTLAQFAHNYAIELQQARFFAEAEILYRGALSVFETHGDVPRAMVTRQQLGRVLQEQGKYEAAVEVYEINLRLARERSDRVRAGANLFQLAQVAQLRGDWQGSESLYEQVLAESPANSRLAAAAAHQLGILAQTRKDYAEAKVWFETALAQARQLNDASLIAAALHHLGMIAQTQNQLPLAKEFYEQSLDRAASCRDSAEAVPTLYQLAQLAQLRSDFVMAEDYARQCLVLAQARGDVAVIQRVTKLMQRLECAATMPHSGSRGS